MTTCPLCPWSIANTAATAVAQHHLRHHLRTEHHLRLAETVVRARAATEPLPAV